ncbi:hypothetical protein ACTXK0_06740 [Corynebacterium variabile]|uniref:Uncharacterized protein n=1 Tax=Corynebacterium variabile TaxID=1727 RepID=A0A0X2NNF7_9CORY|nr:hypothetical protein [Corynebacterium variabile]CUU67037.1 hypothetical protein CVAR292_02390 [Corynebacterium variabile]
MANDISYGFLRPQDSDFSDISLTVECGNDIMNVTCNSENRQVTELSSWGRGNDVLVKAEFSTDLTAVVEDCDLPLQGSRLGALLRWNCPSTSIRGYGNTVPVTDTVSRPTVRIPGDQIAGAVSVELDVVLLDNPVTDPDSVAPARPGSVLWSRSLRLHLEGVGATVHTSSYDFSEAHEFDPGAMWRIHLESDPELHVTRAIRVCLNTSNKITKVALDNINSGKSLTKETQMWQRFLDIDLRTHLLWAALGLSHEHALSEYEYDEESYGQMLYGTLRSYFPDDDPASMLRKAATDPGLIAARVQNNYGDKR